MVASGCPNRKQANSESRVFEKPSDVVRAAVRGTLLRQPGLTPRLVEVLEQLADGRTPAGVADELYLSPRTIQDDMSELKDILHLADRTQLPAHWLKLVYQVIDTFCLFVLSQPSDGLALGTEDLLNSRGKTRGLAGVPVSRKR